MAETKQAPGTSVPIEVREYNSRPAYYAPARFEISEGENCLSALFALAKSNPHVVLFERPVNFEWVNVTAREFVDKVKEVAKGFIHFGVEPGDRVMLLSNTRYEWQVIDYAIWAAGGVVVPVYPSSSSLQVQWMVEDSGATLAVTETREHTEILDHLVLQDDGKPRLSDSSSHLKKVLEINGGAVEQLCFEGRDVSDAELDSRINGIKHDDAATINYTSGTTGNPKGCILTHYNWMYEVRALQHDGIAYLGAPGNRIVTYLPLAHVLAHAVSLLLCTTGATQAYWQNTSTLTVAFERFRPHLVLGVPRVFEKVRNAAYNKAAEGSAIGAAVFKAAERTAIQYSKAMDTPEGPSRVLKARRAVFDRLVYQKLREAFGGQMVYGITGGSAMSSELSHFFRGFGIPIYEGYGLTETAAACALGYEDQRIGSIGQPLNGFGARTDEDGEIYICGGAVFKSYWKNEEATKEALHDGWFRTGDIGEISETGHITITGRAKDIIVTAGGKNIYPAPLEEIMRGHPIISQALVVGDGQPFPAVLVTLDEAELARWKMDRNISEHRPLKELAADPALQAEVQDAINAANATVSHAEAIKKFRILDRDLSEENNELTPTLKVKRNVVFKRFADEIAAIYER